MTSPSPRKASSISELNEKAEEVSSLLKQLAHPDRLRVLCALLDGEQTVSGLVETVGSSQSWISQCLGRMKAEGIISSRKEGAFVHYRISDPRIQDLMRAIDGIFCRLPS
jgi:DNA-binding transcriptional ArsR family regulator